MDDTTDTTPQKACSKCHAPKPATADYYHRDPRLGLASACKECESKRRRRPPRPHWTVRFWSKVDKTPGQGPWGDCWMWRGSRDTYGRFWLNGANREAHRVAYELAKGPLGDQGNHRCNEYFCVNPDHVYDGSQLDNMRDRALSGKEWDSAPKNPASGERNGLHRNPEKAVRGERHPQAKLTDATAAQALRLCAEGWSAPKVARLLGVSPTTIRNLNRGDIWKHIPRPTNERDIPTESSTEVH
jgi:hypothetical protein